MPTIKPHVGERVREFRKARGLSQTELAELMGTGQTQVSRIELAEHDLMFSTILRLSEVLGVDARELLEPEKKEGHVEVRTVTKP